MLLKRGRIIVEHIPEGSLIYLLFFVCTPYDYLLQMCLVYMCIPRMWDEMQLHLISVQKLENEQLSVGVNCLLLFSHRVTVR